MGKGGGGMPPMTKVGLARSMTRGLHSSRDPPKKNQSSDEQERVLRNRTEGDRGYIPGKPNGGGGKGGPPKGPP